jgi:glyoxylase-like metal-dependent hydrolase (beta-lactamase superfamily II)
MMKYETALFGGPPGRWEKEAKNRPDVAASRLKPPTVFFNKDLIFDDGTHRIELMHLGVAHTHGDGFAWLPREKILFTGDACVNGPDNFAGDGNVEQWIRTLAAAEKLGAKTVCPGHGPVAGGELLSDQKSFFVELRRQVKREWKRDPAQMKGQVDAIRAALLSQARIAKFVGDFLPAQVEKVYTELGGKAFPAKAAAERSLDSGRELADR